MARSPRTRSPRTDDVFAAYEAQLASTDFGTPVQQTDRALTSLAQWVSVGVSTESILQGSPQQGPVLLDMGIDRSTLNLPAGFSVRWIAAFSDENLPGEILTTGGSASMVRSRGHLCATSTPTPIRATSCPSWRTVPVPEGFVPWCIAPGRIAPR